MAKSAKQLADEAYLRVMGDVPAGTLPGQIDALSGAVAGEGAGTAEPPIPTLPRECPKCARPMPSAHSWTHMRALAFPYVQCGNCGHMLPVTEDVWSAVREAAIRMFAGSDLTPHARGPKPGREGRRTRGAG